jgi:hypothetical protein
VPSHRDCPARRPAPQRTEARGCSPSCLRATCSASPRAPTHDGRHDPRLRRAPSTSSDRTGPAGGATTAHPTGDAEAVPQRSPLRDCREASEKDNSRGVTGAPARVRKQAFRSAPTRPVSGRGPGAQPSCQKTPPFPRFRHSRRRPLRPQGSRPPRGRGPLPQGTGCEPPNQSPEPPAPGEARCLLANAGARALERHSRAGRRLPPKEA